jgi:hypothetical protein
MGRRVCPAIGPIYGLLVAQVKSDAVNLGKIPLIHFVTPAKAGVHKYFKSVDSGSGPE